MKSKPLHHFNAICIGTLLLMFFSFLLPLKLKAQQDYLGNLGKKIATTDSRLFASIYETDTSVVMKVMAIGYMDINMFDFAVFYDPDVLRLCNSNYNEISAFGVQSAAGTLSPDLLGWLANCVHKNVGLSSGDAKISGHATMRSIFFDCGLFSGTQHLKLQAGEVKTLLTTQFKKQTTGHQLTQDDFGLAINTDGMIHYQSKFGADGMFLWYRDLRIAHSTDKKDINPELFLFRSGSSLSTNAATNIMPISATLNGYFLQGTLPSSHTILDTTGTAIVGKGRLQRDAVKTFGFIYGTKDVALTIDEFSQLMSVNNTSYPVPTDLEILAGTFTRGGFTFKIHIVDNNTNMKEDSSYYATITGLQAQQQYYAWAYTHYTYETSNTYQAVGNRITFTTTDCIPLNIGTVFTAKEPNCGASDGEIYVAVSGGSGSYEFSTNGVLFTAYSGDTITGLGAGTYTIWVRDANHPCTETSIDNIVLHNDNTDLNVMVTATNSTSCNPTTGAGTGALHITLTGGVAPYTYFLNGVNVTSSVAGGTITGLSAGAYILEIQDFKGCKASSSVVRINLTTPTLFVTKVSAVNTDCGESTGEYRFKVSGNKTFSYEWDGYSTMNITYLGTDTTIALTGLNAGAHILRVKDDCNQIIDTITITNGINGLAFTTTAQSELLSCNGVLLPGSITITATGATGALEYSINDTEWTAFPSGLTTVTLSNLHHGSYRIEVRDLNNDCTYEINQIKIEREIYSPINVGTVYTAVHPTCNVPNGKIQVFATGGSGHYLYGINGATPVSYSGGLIDNLAAGAYSITVVDAIFNTCVGVTINNIILHNDNTDLRVTLTPENASTCGEPNGKLFVTVTGGTGNNQYFLNGSAATIVDGWITDLTVGEYELKVIDGTSCVATSGKVNIYGNDVKVQVAITVTGEATCGSSTGAISATISGTTNYKYQLDGYPEETGTGATLKLTGLSAGVHYLRVKSLCGEATEKFTITNGANAFAFTATATHEIVSCNGTVLPGSINIAITNGIANYAYRINGGAWEPLTVTSNTATIPDLNYGFYRVEVKDGSDCIYEVNKVTIERKVIPLLSVGTIYAAKDPDCGTDNGAIQIFATGGSGHYQYIVNGAAAASYKGGLINNLTAGTYIITVIDSVYNTCAGVTLDAFILHNGDTDLNVDLTPTNASKCNEHDGKLFVTVTGGNGPLSYSLNGTTPTIVDGWITGLAVKEYELVVTDATGCVATSGKVNIYADDSNLDITIVPATPAICGSNTGTAQVNVTGSTSYSYYLDGLPEQTGTAASFSLTGLSAGIHSLRVTDACGAVVKPFTITNGASSFSFNAFPENEKLTCDSTLLPGSITLAITGGTPNFEYSINGSAWKALTIVQINLAVIDSLHQGSYLVEVRDANKCTYEVNQVIIERETPGGTFIPAPVAATPQIFCKNATVANLQATGMGIKWYAVETGGTALLPTAVLDSGAIYYAAQSFGYCESRVRTAVKVYIDPFATMDTAHIASPQQFCNTSGLTLADVATDGNTNIVWYDAPTGGTELPLTTTLLATKYYATLRAGDCESATRVEVEIVLGASVPNAPIIKSPQYFCEGAFIYNIAVPNNKIVWYLTSSDVNPLQETYVLEDGVTYWAAQTAGNCESATRTPVTIETGKMAAPILPGTQGICGKATLADLEITGAGIVWYSNENDLVPIPSNTELVVGTIYWAAQSSENCEGERLSVRITDTCYKVYGTMFPFVYTKNKIFDEQFPVTVTLYAVPPVGATNPFTTFATPVKRVQAIYYDGSLYIPGTPKNPGAVGAHDNPGLTIDWGETPGTPDNTPAAIGEAVPNVGMFTFTNLAPNDYILEISRDGFITRWGKITISKHGISLGHRELIAGDTNEDGLIDFSDMSNTWTGIGNATYYPKYDFNADGTVTQPDLQIIRGNINANLKSYLETLLWLNVYGY